MISGNMLMLGCGAVGRGVLPLLLGEQGLGAAQLTILAADAGGRQAAQTFGVRYVEEPVTRANHRRLLARFLAAGDVLLNLSVNVSSLDLIAWCKAHGVLYLDTCIEPWPGGYGHERGLESTNAWLRQQALAMYKPGAPTAVVAHGMNPGLVSHFLKDALRALAQARGMVVSGPPAWGALAQALGVKAVHIAERDTQDDGLPLPPGEFANSWSAGGFYSECWLQHAEAGWGAHETALPEGAVLMHGGRGGVLRFAQPGAELRLRSWVPSAGEQEGMLVTHHETASIADLLTHGDYRPTVCYVYHACPKAWNSVAGLLSGQPVARFRVLDNEAMEGTDEVGVLLIHETGALWHGSTLSARAARQLAPGNSATSLQVAAGILGALAWMRDHPCAGVVEAEDMDSAQVLAAASPWLGRISTSATDWRPGGALEFGDFLAPVKMRQEIRRGG